MHTDNPPLARLILEHPDGVRHEVPVHACWGMHDLPASDPTALTWVLTTAMHKLVSEVSHTECDQADLTAQLIEADWRSRVIVGALRGQLQAAHDLLTDLQIPWDKKIWEATVRTIQEHEAGLVRMRKQHGALMRNSQGAPWGRDPVSKPPADTGVPVEPVTKQVKKVKKVK